MYITCFQCIEKGHIIRECTRKEINLKTRRKGYQDQECRKRTMKCWSCHKIGHRESKCMENIDDCKGG